MLVQKAKLADFRFIAAGVSANLRGPGVTTIGCLQDRGVLPRHPATVGIDEEDIRQIDVLVVIDRFQNSLVEGFLSRCCRPFGPPPMHGWRLCKSQADKYWRD